MAQKRIFELPLGGFKIVGTAITDNPARQEGGAPVLRKILYSAAQKEQALAQFKAIQFGSGLVVELEMQMTSATTDYINMGVEIMAMPVGENVDLLSYDTINTVFGGVLVPGAKGRFKVRIECVNNDGLKINDMVSLRIPREIASQFDNASGDAELVGVVVSYNTSSSSSSTSSSSTSSSSSSSSSST